MPIGAGYVRVYQSILTDGKFEKVYKDDHLLATWLRLLLVADQMWPSPAPVPRSVRVSSMKMLVSVGLVDLLPQDCFRIHGLDAERNARSQWGRNAAAVRWQSASNAGALRTQYPPNALPSPSPRPSPSPSPSNGSQSDFDRRVEATQRELKKLRGES